MNDIHAIAMSLTTLAEHCHDWVLQLIDSESGATFDIGTTQRVYHGGHGRPPYHIPQSQLEALTKLRFTYEKIATGFWLPVYLFRQNIFAIYSFVRVYVYVH